MHLRSLFTSSSKVRASQTHLRSAFFIAFWFLVALVAFDLGVNFLFPYPSYPIQTPPPKLNTYFDYGRSIEGQFRQGLSPEDSLSSPLLQAGWLGELEKKDLPAEPQEGKVLLAFYGMSFTQHLVEALQQLDPPFDYRLVLGPSAPPNYVYGAYQNDRGRHAASVVVFSILATSVSGLEAMSGATLWDDRSAPFTFPKYKIVGDQLVKVNPLVSSQADLREYLNTPGKLQAWRKQLEDNDSFYHPFLYQSTVLDNSTLVRLFRRALSKSLHQQVNHRIHDSQGFKSTWEGGKILQKMVVEFAVSVRADGKVPLVLLFNSQGYDDHLDRLLVETLKNHSIPYFSSYDIAPSTDNNNYQSDGHFTKAVDRKMAEAFLPYLQGLLKNPSPR